MPERRRNVVRVFRPAFSETIWAHFVSHRDRMIAAGGAAIVVGVVLFGARGNAQRADRRMTNITAATPDALTDGRSDQPVELQQPEGRLEWRGDREPGQLGGEVTPAACDYVDGMLSRLRPRRTIVSLDPAPQDAMDLPEPTTGRHEYSMRSITARASLHAHHGGGVI